MTNIKSTEFEDRYVQFILDKKRIYSKAFNSLMQISFDNKIPVLIFKESEDLDEWHFPGVYNLDLKRTYGFFSYIGTYVDKTLVRMRPVSISIACNGDKSNSAQLVHSFAHELGHFFSIRKNLDESEESANLIAIKLFKGVLSKEEFLKIEPEMKIINGASFYYSDEDAEDGKEYFDLNGYANRIKSYKNKLRKKAYTHLSKKINNNY